ncbi:putative uncharacterized protein DDB_G0278921 [Condylostylus longicornis]|uniref:putative uncharacterized protein DDB_G0278921 n=1 Tax=Condylostylus longicornis TaxID=2530218 RepID=UPI00244DD93B|nr:putative uncharacterized protein DDB_G0278921 [Condylostylus longicornis]
MDFTKLKNQYRVLFIADITHAKHTTYGGSLVLIHEPNFPAPRWTLGKILEEHKNRNDLTRVATLQTKNGEIKRPITSLIFLAVKTPNNEPPKVVSSQDTAEVKPKPLSEPLFYHITATQKAQSAPLHYNLHYQRQVPISEQNTASATNTPLVLQINPLKYIDGIPEYNGKGEDLYKFIELVENEIPLTLQYDVSSQTILLSRIKSRFTSRAREMIEINSHLNTWSEIFDELRGVKFTSNSVEFYNDIKSILRRLSNKIKDEPNAHALIQANTQTGLRVFKDKIPEPMKSILFSRNPTSLENAINILHEGNYTKYNPFKKQKFKDNLQSSRHNSNSFRNSNNNSNNYSSSRNFSNNRNNSNFRNSNNNYNNTQNAGFHNNNNYYNRNPNSHQNLRNSSHNN